MNLIERAKQDAKARAKEERAKDREAQEKYNAEVAEMRAAAAEFVGTKLEVEINPESLGVAVGVVGDDIDLRCWHLTVDGFDLEVRKTTSTFSLYLLPSDEDSEPRYIRRLADLVS